MKIKMILAYDGTRYLGWQKTKTGPSVQEALEKALFQILRKDVRVEASSRTDRGVHAEGQAVHFLIEEAPPMDRLVYGVNSALPWDIRVIDAEMVHEEFHSTLWAESKEYRYSICNRAVEDPMRRLYSWHIHEPLDVEAMRRAARALLGKHDFASFTTIKSEDTIRTLFDIQVLVNEGWVDIRITGDRFLYKMMRRLVGTLVGVGKGTLSEDEVLALLAEPNRAKAGVTAPAHGLFLHKVTFRRAFL